MPDTTFEENEGSVFESLARKGKGGVGVSDGRKNSV
jgi:hypothetical protein